MNVKGQLISDYQVYRWVARNWVTGIIKVQQSKRFYGRLRPTEGTFINVELD